jgi:uncharacterized protein YecE (DUF72 family)
VTLFVGTSGWAYKEWKPAFYPAGVPQTRFLEHYATQLPAVEVNATFYRVQSETTVQKWQNFTSPGFKFAAKAHYLLTHRKQMVWGDDQKEFLHDFVKSLAGLNGRLGPVLLQHPPHRQRNDEDLAAVVEALPSNLTFVFEFRNDTWDDPAVEDQVAEAGAGLCVSDTTGEVPARLPAGAVGYVRLRAERYTQDQRAGWLDLLLDEARERDVYAFTKHKGIDASDEYGGVGLARWLHEQTRDD